MSIYISFRASFHHPSQCCIFCSRGVQIASSGGIATRQLWRAGAFGWYKRCGYGFVVILDAHDNQTVVTFMLRPFSIPLTTSIIEKATHYAISANGRVLFPVGVIIARYLREIGKCSFKA